MAKFTWNGIEYDGCIPDGDAIVTCIECGPGIISPRCIHGNCCFHCLECQHSRREP